MSIKELDRLKILDQVQKKQINQKQAADYLGLSKIRIRRLAKEAEMPRSTLYHSLKSKNPTIKTVAKLIHCTL